MRTLLIGYDLNKGGKNYEEVIDYIKAEGTWWHHLDSTWIIRTEKTVQGVRDGIKSVGLDSDDELLVVELNGVGAWAGFSPRGSTWLKDHL